MSRQPKIFDITKDIQVLNDTRFSMIELLDRSSLKYPSKIVYQFLLIMYELFLKIDDHSHLSKIMYEGSCRKKLFQLSLIVVKEACCEICREWCVCMVPKWEILKKIYTTVANCIFSKKARNFNSIVVGWDNRKLQKFSTYYFLYAYRYPPDTIRLSTTELYTYTTII